MARLYRFFFFSFPTSKTLSSAYVDQMMKKKGKKKREKNRTRLLIMRVEEISFCETSSTRLFLWKKAFLLYLAPMIIFPFKNFSFGTLEIGWKRERT